MKHTPSKRWDKNVQNYTGSKEDAAAGTKTNSLRCRVVGVGHLLAPLPFARMNVTAVEPIDATAGRSSATITTFKIMMNRW